MAGVFAPLRPGLVPGNPQPAAAIAGQARMRLKHRRAIGAENVAEFRGRAAGQAADANSVIAALISIPSDPDAIASRIGGNNGVPIVGLGRADADGVVPAVAIDAASEDVGLPVAEALPDQPGPAALIGGHGVPDVRPGIFGETDFFAELAVLIGTREQIPVVLALAGPDDPQRITVRAGQGDAEMIARPGHFHRLRPGAVRPVAFGE